jgi:malonyl-CoA O-methyltransferase
VTIENCHFQAGEADGRTATGQEATEPSLDSALEGAANRAKPQTKIYPPLEAHERWAEFYEEMPNPILSVEERSLLPLLPDLRSLAVADLGCGTGRWLSRFRGMGAQFYAGIDLSPAMLRQASRKSSLRGSLVRGDVRQVPFRSEAFDFVLCSFVLGYLEPLEAIARTVQRVLKPAGRLFCTDLHPATHQLGWKRSFRSDDQIIEIESNSYSIGQVLGIFEKRFRLVAQKSFFLGEPERPLFEKADKPDIFEAACQVPAVIFFEWQKAG